VIPSAFAVLRLIPSSNLVGCSIGKICWLGAFQDLVNVCRRVAVVRGEVSAIAKQLSRDHVLAQRIGHRQPGRLHQLLQLGALGKVRPARDHHGGLSSLSNDLADGGAEDPDVATAGYAKVALRQLRQSEERDIPRNVARYRMASLFPGAAAFRTSLSSRMPFSYAASHADWSSSAGSVKLR
jgi:hypothetical protein